MAMMPVPSWLSVNPTDYLNAVKSGTAAGIDIAQAQNRAEEIANAAAARRWEFEQSIRQKALDLMAERERAAANLAATERYRETQGLLGAERLAETRRYHDLMAGNAAALTELKRKEAETSLTGEKVHFGQNGEVLISKRDPETGEWTVNQLRPGSRLPGLLSAESARSLLNSQYAPLLDRQYGPGTTEKLRKIVSNAADATLGAGPVPSPVTPPLTQTTLPSSAAAAGAPRPAAAAPKAAAPAAPVPKVYIGPRELEPGPLQPNEKEFPMKDGRRAIFNVITKKFVRWAQ